ncbi:hypothetical protein LCGC14_0355870 [marine sediment metagenome]|uniref:Uncharacterized protein n=1 Tax=marine sediment metagenome TaxID=412755 RepID=A0A0F9T9G8_9ZZZZ
MNAIEKKYAVSRIEDLASTVRNSINNRSRVEPLNKKQMIKLLQTGKVNAKKNSDISYYGTCIYSLFDWTPFLFIPELSDKQANIKKAKLAADVQETKDAIMLGDNNIALEFINKFAGRCKKL